MLILIHPSFLSLPIITCERPPDGWHTCRLWPSNEVGNFLQHYICKHFGLMVYNQPYRLFCSYELFCVIIHIWIKQIYLFNSDAIFLVLVNNHLERQQNFIFSHSCFNEYFSGITRIFYPSISTALEVFILHLFRKISKTGKVSYVYFNTAYVHIFCRYTIAKQLTDFANLKYGFYYNC